MNKMTLGARILLGLIFVAVGFNDIFHFLPAPHPNEAAMNFFGALSATGYFIPLLKITQFICGILILSGFYTALALTVLAPVTINILLFHIFLDHSGLPLAIVIIISQIIAAYGYKEKYLPLLTAK